MIPGEMLSSHHEIILNAGLEVTLLTVSNLGDRPIQVGSHFHFFEVNTVLSFDREKTLGKRLNIPSGTAIRFEPGDKKTIELVPFTGDRKIIGFNGLVNKGL